MTSYKIFIDPDALTDIQEITNWYNQQKYGLGTKFQKSVIKQINSLKKNAHIYSIRYNEIRCMLIRKFPYMVHYYVNKEIKTVEILAVISTKRDPKIWEEKLSSRR